MFTHQSSSAVTLQILCPHSLSTATTSAIRSLTAKKKMAVCSSCVNECEKYEEGAKLMELKMAGKQAQSVT